MKKTNTHINALVLALSFGSALMLFVLAKPALPLLHFGWGSAPENDVYFSVEIPRHQSAPQEVTNKGSMLTKGAVSPIEKRTNHALEARIIPEAPQQTFVDHPITLLFQSDDGIVSSSWTTSIVENPQWLSWNNRIFGLSSYNFDRAQMLASLTAKYLEFAAAPLHSTILSIASGAVLRAQVTEIARGGYALNEEEAVNALMKGIIARSDTVTIPLQWEHGRVYEPVADGSVREYELLAAGKSNFAGSPLGRELNVHKALEQHLQNIVVPQGTTFSFNSALGGPITLSRGWKEALGIFEGGALRPTPGGGICQTSTTMYRAVLKAGLPVVERRAHSLYVKYYEKYGVGIDATVFSGSPDLKFINDTNGPLVIQTVIEGKDATVNIYGIPDGRNVELTGPYVQGTVPQELMASGMNLGKNEIAWTRRVAYPDGRVAEETILSKYNKGIPRNAIAEKKMKEFAEL